MNMQISSKPAYRFFIMMSMVLVPLMFSNHAHAFCGYFVAKADAKLFNKASKVVLARHKNRTVITMANDYRGNASNFSIIIPVPTAITESQVNVTESRIVDHLDAYTAPRLVEYFDEDPCRPMPVYENMMAMSAARDGVQQNAKKSAEMLGVTVEAKYSVGEYDIQILSAKQSDGLLVWLNQEGYKLPPGAERPLRAYIKQDMKFFIATVNLSRFERYGYSFLRPLQVAFESSKFGLPIRLGMLNAEGPQDLILFTLTKNGRVETTNYRTVKIPSNMDIPVFVKNEFDDFYQAVFAEAVEKEEMKVVFTEYAWDMGWCDPCAADPLSNDDLRTLGVWWLDGNMDKPMPVPMQNQRAIAPAPPQGQNVFVTRLHMRYTDETFPEDLALQETSDRANFQGRYVLRHAWKGNASCEAGRQYLQSLPARYEKEAQNLARITGWDISAIREKMEDDKVHFDVKDLEPEHWWEDMWDKKSR